MELGPIPAVDGVVRWCLKDLALWIFEEFSISIGETTVGRELRALGFAKLSARPRHHAQKLRVYARNHTSCDGQPLSKQGFQ